MAEGCISQAGSCVEWAVSVGMATSPQETSDLANSVEDANDIYFVPGNAIL
jgi:glycerol kinase